MRATLKEIGLEMTIDQENRLWLRGREIGLVYFRTCYQEDQFNTQSSVDGWQVRLDLELSMAIKCPSIDV